MSVHGCTPAHAPFCRWHDCKVLLNPSHATCSLPLWPCLFQGMKIGLLTVLATMRSKNHTFCLVLGNLWVLELDIYIYKYTHVRVCMCVYIYIYCISMHIYTSISTYIYVCMYSLSLICRSRLICPPFFFWKTNIYCWLVRHIPFFFFFLTWPVLRVQ